jgi:serine/threonine-protein kinase HipA
MARPRTGARAPLNVFMNGKHVGQLRRDTSGAIDFRYDASWLDWESAMPVSCSLPLREERYVGAPVVAVFENLLPDDESMRRRVAERSGAAGTDPYSLLTAIGRDCVGALQFIPDGDGIMPSGGVEGHRISDAEIGALLKDLGRSPLGITDDDSFRISLAGAQEKTALLRWKGRWYRPKGTTPTTHILKPQIGLLENGIDLSKSVENEHLCLELIRAFGLPTAKSEIVDFDGKRTLVVERFDRLWTKDKRLLRVPQEDCCQALSVPPSLKYESQGGPGIAAISELLKGSDTPRDDQIRFFKAQVIFWLIGATDGHAKNFSIRLSPGGRFVLAPLYDVLSTQPNLDAGQIQRNRMKLSMAVGNTRHYVLHTIAPRHFVETAKASKLPVRAETILDEVADAAGAAMDKVLSALPKHFPQKMANSIRQGALLRRDLLVRQ